MRLALIILVSLPAFSQIHINCGSLDDTMFSGGMGYESVIPLPAGAAPFYKFERGGTFGYRIPVADGAYNVSLHMIENSTAVTGPGQRSFSVTINGQPVIPVLDIAALVGLNVPLTRSFPVLATGGTGISILFVALVRNAVVSAIDVMPIGTVPPVNPPPVVTPPVASNPFPDCASDLAHGLSIVCQGGISMGKGGNFASVILLTGGVGFAGTAASGPVVLLIPPSGVPLPGQVQSVKGVVPCLNLDAATMALKPTCVQMIWK